VRRSVCVPDLIGHRVWRRSPASASGVSPIALNAIVMRRAITSKSSFWRPGRPDILRADAIRAISDGIATPQVGSSRTIESRRRRVSSHRSIALKSLDCDYRRMDCCLWFRPSYSAEHLRSESHSAEDIAINHRGAVEVARARNAGTVWKRLTSSRFRASLRLLAAGRLRWGFF
jgi:hypothetical protein